MGAGYISLRSQALLPGGGGALSACLYRIFQRAAKQSGFHPLPAWESGPDLMLTLRVMMSVVVGEVKMSTEHAD